MGPRVEEFFDEEIQKQSEKIWNLMIFGLREILVIALIAILSSSFWHSDSFVTESKKDQYTNDIFLSADKRMKAVRVHENGGPEALTYETDCPRPASAGAGEVVIRNNYAGINFIDTYHR